MTETEALLYQKTEQDDDRVVCGLCRHRCVIPDGARGLCRTRENRGGRLISLVYGRCIALTADPIEKKPLYHFLPGSLAMSMATVGCNFHCPFCQNYHISQYLKDVSEEPPGQTIEPIAIVEAALARGCSGVSYTYTEPTVFFEYALDTARLARERGLTNSFVSNGYMTPEAVDAIAPYLDAINVDLKSFNPTVYRDVIGGELEEVLESVRYLHDKGVWIELTTLLIEDLNDSGEELRQLTRFIRDLSPDIPWHVSRFHPDYRMGEATATSTFSIENAVEIGRREGLNFIYCGNMRDNRHESTWCPHCGEQLIGRSGYFVLSEHLDKKGHCLTCGARCPGVWTLSPTNEGVEL